MWTDAKCTAEASWSISPLRRAAEYCLTNCNVGFLDPPGVHLGTALLLHVRSIKLPGCHIEIKTIFGLPTVKYYCNRDFDDQTPPTRFSIYSII